MGGPSKSDIQKNADLATTQTKLAQTQIDNANANYAKSEAAIQPSIDFNTGVTKDQNSLLVAMAPLLSQITRGAATTKQQIMDSVPAGPARDLALAQTSRDTQDQIASTKNQTYTGALDKLASIGSGLGSFSLSETGAGLQGTQEAMNSNQAVVQAKAQKKAAMMAPFTALAGGLGGAVGGGFGKSLFGGGSLTPAVPGTYNPSGANWAKF